jgi:hypothetical protein
MWTIAPIFTQFARLHFQPKPVGDIHHYPATIPKPDPTPQNAPTPLRNWCVRCSERVQVSFTENLRYKGTRQERNGVVVSPLPLDPLYAGSGRNDPTTPHTDKKGRVGKDDDVTRYLSMETSCQLLSLKRFSKNMWFSTDLAQCTCTWNRHVLGEVGDFPVSLFLASE